MGIIYRESVEVTTAVDTAGNIANCTVLTIAGRSGAVVNIPSGSSINELAVYHSPTEAGTYLPLYRAKSDLTVEAVTLTGLTAGTAVALPVDVFPCRCIKLVGNAAGSVVTCFKS